MQTTANIPAPPSGEEVVNKINSILASAYDLGIGVPVIELSPEEYHVLMRSISPYEIRRRADTREKFLYYTAFGEVNIEVSRRVRGGLRAQTFYGSDNIKDETLYEILKEKIK